MQLKPGKPYPLGAKWDGTGTNFTLFSENATRVELCLFDSPGATRESAKFELTERTDQVWHGFIQGVGPGQLYGFRVHGPYEPEKGHRFNPNKVVLDPYAKAIGREVRWDDDLFGYGVGNAQEDLSFDERDNAAHAPLAAVADERYDWGDDKAPDTPWHKTLIYELHVKGFTKLHPGVPGNLRGTYAGLASPEVIGHLKGLGVTAVELMPVHHFLQDRHLVEKGLANYWGYNTLAFLAPEPRYAAAHGDPNGTLREFKDMVKAFHAEGIEVILDVVYNHTAEGNHLGPTLSFRGIDNLSYYKPAPESPRFYMDYTGCGNTPDMGHPKVLQLVMDSLRYWTLEMHVDGFRFDLAPALARQLHEVDKLGAFFDIIHQDPVLSQVKLIAEPWDLGEGGYQVGNFPLGWTEWNGKYRDSVRKFWKGEGGALSEFATRITGSSDLYELGGRRPSASINFITAHDGFTLNDLVSYNEKHNEANGEGNNDGESNNNSWNCGAEGPSGDPTVNAIRERQKRNFLVTLLLSQGVPMLSHGDEIARTQGGNNNVYAQDSEISWMNWNLSPAQRDLLEFTRRAAALWRANPVFHRRKFFQGRGIWGQSDIQWFKADASDMSDEDWNAPHVSSFGMRLVGNAMDEVDEEGERVTGDSFALLFNASHVPIDFAIPPLPEAGFWKLELDSDPDKKDIVVRPGQAYPLRERSIAVLRQVNAT
jgi:glycogen operon protein